MPGVLVTQAMEIPMIRPDDEKSMAKDLGEIWTDALRYRSQLPRSRMQCRVSDDDRAVYGKWRRGVIIFYGLLALLFLATGTMGRIFETICNPDRPIQSSKSDRCISMKLLEVTRAVPRGTDQVGMVTIGRTEGSFADGQPE
jgi:hypothetical protein